MRKIIAVLFFAAVVAAVVWYYTNRTTQQAIIQRSLSDTALSFFDEETKALTSAQIAVEQAEANLRLLQLKKQQERARLEIEGVKTRLAIENAVAVGWRVALFAAFGCAGLCGMYVFVQRNAFVHQKIGESCVWVSRRFLNSQAGALWLAGTVQIENVRAANPAAALEMTAAHLRALRGMMSRKEHSHIIDITPNGEQAATLPELTPAKVPTFAELLKDGGISQGQPMILGYSEGMAIRGSFLDIYSAAVAGESGSGKTSTMLFLIGSGLLSCNAQFHAIDPHYPHPKSLGAKTRALWESGLIQMATHKDDILSTLQYFEAAIDARLKGTDRSEKPLVLVIDELYFLSKTSVRAAVVHTMERISTEGRKCAIYMLASSQVWLAKMFDNSAWRDTLTSAYVHKIKPKEAQLLLQDKREVERVRTEIKRAGEVLFLATTDSPQLCQIPFTDTPDMIAVAEILRGKEGQKRQDLTAKNDGDDGFESDCGASAELTDSADLRTTPQTTPKMPRIDPEFVRRDLNAQIDVDKTAGRYESKNKWLTAFCERFGLNFGTVDKMTRDTSAAGLELWGRVAESLIEWKSQGRK